MTTDYVSGTAPPELYLRRIAEAGFTHVHWCQQWNTDHLYSGAEIAEIAGWLRECGLRLLDLHASAGVETNWTAEDESRRRAGVDLVRNRMAMTGQLGAAAVVLHPAFAADDESGRAVRERWLRSLDELAGCSRELGVRIALENGNRRGLEETEMAFERYGPEYLGVCFDSGHANLHGADLLERHPDRLISVHLHDNDGSGDQHRIPFTGTVDWESFAGLIAASSYRKPVSLETSTRNSPITDEREFLAANFEAAERLARMVHEARSKLPARGPGQ